MLKAHKFLTSLVCILSSVIAAVTIVTMSAALPYRTTLLAAPIDNHGKRLPDGQTTKRPSGDIRAAWLSHPTGRYAHGVLGDAIEAGAITVRKADGKLSTFILPETSVFEDLVPRLGDLNGDGRTELVLVRSYLSKGAAVAVFGLRAGELTLLAETPAIGRANRWLNPSILADLDGSGRLTIGLVRTPHIGGQLQLWRFQNGKLQLSKRADGFSNHSIGSRSLGLSAVLSKGKKQRLLLPDAYQSNLLLLDADTLQVLERFDLTSRPVRDFKVRRNKTGQQSVEIKLSNGTIFRLKPGSSLHFD